MHAILLSHWVSSLSNSGIKPESFVAKMSDNTDSWSLEECKKWMFFRFGSEVKKSDLQDTRDITPKRVTKSGFHLRGVVPGPHSSEETV